MDRFGNPPWSILLSLGNKGRLRWRLSHHRVTIASARTASARVRHRALRHGRASSRGRQHGHQRTPSPRRQQRQHHDDTGSKGQRAHRHHGTRQAAPSPRPDRRRSGEAVERGTATGATGHRDSRASARAGRSRSPWGQSSRAVSPVAQSVAQTLIEPPTDTPEGRRKAFIARAFRHRARDPNNYCNNIGQKATSAGAWTTSACPSRTDIQQLPWLVRSVPPAIGRRVLWRAPQRAGNARLHLSRISASRKSVVAVTVEAVRPTQCPLCPDSDQILRRSEMTRCANRRHVVIRSAQPM